MKSFIKSSILFSVVLFIIFIALGESIEYFVNKNANFRIDSNPKYIIVGHSHSECAFNDSLIGNLKNLSQSGESYFYTFIKIKKILQQNPSIEVVFIEFTNNQIDEKMDNWTFDKEHMSYRYPMYSPFMDISDKLYLASNNLPAFTYSISLSLKNNFSRVLNQNFEYSNIIGGYLYLVRDRTDSLLSNMAIDNFQLNNFNIADDNLAYLSHIIQYCEAVNKKVILIRSPQHKKYQDYFNEVKYREILNTRYSGIEYFDFSKFPLTNSEFGDLGHLNYKGARVFSQWFAIILKNGVLYKPDKQKFISDQIKVRIYSYGHNQ